MPQKSNEEVLQEFHKVVNMEPEELEEWLQTEDSKSVGFHNEGEAEAVGHASGHHIIDLLEKGDDEYDQEDYEHARKVVGYVHRHLAQRHRLKDGSAVEDSRWRHSLMNWGHDPLKD